MGGRKCQELFDDTGNQRLCTRLFQQLGVVWCFEEDAERLESDWTDRLACDKGEDVDMTYPIILSYCCCLMLDETLQSTWPELRVMASASAISDWMEAGMPGFLFAGPTQNSVEPACSNSVVLT